ncbi:MAG: cytochrome c peroxidase [Caulobacteraceae bacterium]|nr:cytochrome c peroxidase [Caulobacteraceae bacterium]
MGAPWRLGLALLALIGLCAAGPVFDWGLPPGVAPPPVPADNPMSPAKVALGRRLFYDADLSIDGTMACATCHEQRRGFSDGNAAHPGVNGEPGRRNPMTLANVGYFGALTWGDPRIGSLERQSIVPLTGNHPVEMGLTEQGKVLAGRLGADPCYRRLFAQAFPDGGGRIELTTIAKALAAFERTLISRDAPFDRYRRGDRAALSASAQQGMALFYGPGQDCASCHAGSLFTDAAGAPTGSLAAFHRIEPVSDRPDQGLKDITGDPADAGRFRTPSLRNVALSAPYLHDGSAPTLGEAIRRHGVMLKDTDLTDLTAFLNSLTDQGFVTDPRFSLPKPGCPAP